MYGFVVRCRFRDLDKEKEGIECERKRLSIETSEVVSGSVESVEVCVSRGVYD